MEVGSTCIDVDFLYKHRCSRLFIHEDADGTFRIRLQSLHLTHSFQVARLSNITAWLKVVQGMELFYSPSVLSGCIREMPLYRLREVKLMSCNVVHSLEAMQNVRNVEILNCAAIENFDGLNNAFDIKIVRCDMLYNIDGMNLSRYINLEACKNLTEANSIDTLLLSWCKSLRYVNAALVQQLRVLQLKGLGEPLQWLDLKQCTNLEKFYISDCHQLDDVIALQALHTVSIMNCSMLENVSPLGHVHTLTISHCPLVENVDALQYVYDLNLSANRKISNVHALSHVHRLNLSGCVELEDVSQLKYVHTLNLAYCPKLVDVTNLQYCFALDLSFCQKITDVSMLGQVHTLDLVGCQGITDVSNLEYVSVLNTSECKNLQSKLPKPKCRSSDHQEATDFALMAEIRQEITLELEKMSRCCLVVE